MEGPGRPWTFLLTGVRPSWLLRLNAGLLLVLRCFALFVSIAALAGPGVARDGGGGGNEAVRQSPCMIDPDSPGCPAAAAPPATPGPRLTSSARPRNRRPAGRALPWVRL